MEEAPDMDSALARAIRDGRIKAGLTQEQASRLVSDMPGVSISPTALAKIETGTRSVRYAEAVALANVLDFALPGIDERRETPADTRRRHLSLVARHLRSKVNAAHAAEGAARARRRTAEQEHKVFAALTNVIEGKPAEVKAYDLQAFGRQILSAVQEAGIPVQEFLDALELPPTDLYDHGPEPIDANMDPGYIADAIAKAYPLVIHEGWKDIEDASDG